MENFDWLSTIKINTKMLKYLSLWPTNGQYKLDLYKLYTTILVLIFIHTYNMSIFMGIIFSHKNLADLTRRIFMTSSEILTSVKTHHFIKNIKTLQLMTEDLESVKFVPPKNTEQIKLVQPDLNIWKLVFTILQLSCWTTVVFIISAPILQRKHELPTPAWFPFNTNISPNYELTYFYQSLGVTVVVAVVISLDVFVMNWMMIIGVQCEILCDNLKNIKNENNNFNKKLIDCIRHHKVIVSLAENCNNRYEMLFLCQLPNSSLTLALTMFQATLVEPASSDVITALAYGAAAVIQIFMYCWFGNRVEFKVSDTRTNFYFPKLKS
ncbi:hypothetical protein Zmor_007602 [Zophobas morio]|uniref:Odorant receptor n=1 Tax=Zophobas morio TaxID=2755281 RepID=A0AA38IXM1_9CUCU|nr:hypothetical protein Zmor_007602 [Zophobas morio]